MSKLGEYKCVCHRLLFRYNDDLMFESMIDKEEFGGIKFDVVIKCSRCNVFHHIRLSSSLKV